MKLLLAIPAALLIGSCANQCQKVEDRLRIDRCIEIQTTYYGDLIGEDPDQSPRHIVEATGEAIKECLR